MASGEMGKELREEAVSAGARPGLHLWEGALGAAQRCSHFERPSISHCLTWSWTAWPGDVRPACVTVQTRGLLWGGGQSSYENAHLYFCFATAHVTLLFTHHFFLSPLGFALCLTTEGTDRATAERGTVSLPGDGGFPISSRVSATCASAPGCPAEGPAGARPWPRHWPDTSAAPHPLLQGPAYSRFSLSSFPRG